MELDSGALDINLTPGRGAAASISQSAIQEIERKLAIVLPIKDEDLKVFEGVLAGVPHDCLMIVVSGSSGADVDVHKNERDIVSHFCQATGRQALVIHQKNPLLAHAFKDARYPEIVGNDGLVKSGKSEGMVVISRNGDVSPR